MKLPVISADKLIKVLGKLGFKPIRQKGSHIQFAHSNGKIITVPMHPSQDLGRGLLRKILRDLEISVEDFIKLL